jgi:hypothetical protein
VIIVLSGSVSHCLPTLVGSSLAHKYYTCVEVNGSEKCSYLISIQH